MTNGIFKDVWGVRGKPDQVGISKIKSDMYKAGKWIKKKYKKSILKQLKIKEI